MEIIGSLLAAFIGVTLGMMGSGGSILTVPVLVYILHVDPNLATTYSLFAIGASSFAGSIVNYFRDTIDFRKVVDFGFPSVVTVFLTRQFFLPLVPDEFIIGNWRIHQSTLLMLIFACVMMLSAFSMIKRTVEPIAGEETVYSRATTIIQGAGVGFVTGIVGAGGGFLIIPALVNFYKMPMSKAVPTSLTIICINSIFGLIGDIEKFELFDWEIISSYTGLLIVGMFVGFYLTKYFNGLQLKKGLSYLIFAISVFIFIKEIILNP